MHWVYFLLQKLHGIFFPLAWAWTGTAVTGFFIIGHDCAHKSFSRNKVVEDIVGTLAFMPLIYPYEPWRFKHDRHHAKTNMSNFSHYLQVDRRYCMATCLAKGNRSITVSKEGLFGTLI